jgi:hypothetical protein
MPADWEASVWVRGRWLFVAFTYDEDLKDQIKALPGAHWFPSEKAWRMPVKHREEVECILRRWGFFDDVDIKAGNADGEWASVMFGALPPRLREPVYKALLRVLHPDVGGDGRVTQQLNDAYRDVDHD